MPDILNGDGLTVKTLTEIIAELAAGMQTIYGSDINIDQNSPDGQLLNIYGQAAIDLRELIVAVYNGFDPDRAIGSVLDERVVINNIERKGGTFTVQPISITVDRTVAFDGLDDEAASVDGVGFTVQDDAGNKFILFDSETLVAGTYSRNFRAQQIGRVETIVNTITNQSTIVLGVTVINNPSGALEIGQNEETDAELRLRRQQSVSIASTGYLNGLLGAVLDLPGVTDAVLYENYTNAVDADGIPAHGTWLVVEGGSNADIAAQYYARKSYGSNMKGAVSVDIVTANGAVFTVLFDRPSSANLWIRFDIQPTIGTAIFNQALIKQYIVDNLNYNIGQFAVTNNITAVATDAINAYGGGGAPVNMEISLDGVTYTDYLTVASLDDQWTLDVSRIAITEL